MDERFSECILRDNVCKVSKSELLRFVEAKFQAADQDQDGQLSIAELGNFLRSVSHPDLRFLRSWERFRS